MEDVTPRTAALATLIERSLTRLSSAPPDAEAPQELLFLGNWHDTVPRALIHDSALTATEMALWLVLKTYADPHHGTAFPKHEILMQHLNTSRLPLIEALTNLRLTRWLSLCGRVRGANTQLYQRVVYALHDEPLPFADALHLDSGYMEFVNATRTKDVGRSKEIADGVFRTIEAEIKKGSPEAAPYALNRVSARIEAIVQEQSNCADSESLSFFAVKRKHSLTAVSQINTPKAIGFPTQSASNEPVNYLNNNGSPRVQILDTGPNCARVQNSDSSTARSRVQNPDSSTNDVSLKNSENTHKNNDLSSGLVGDNHFENNGSPRVQNLDTGPNWPRVQNSDSSTADFARAGSSSFNIKSKNIYKTTTTSKKYINNTNTREGARAREAAPFATGSSAQPDHGMSHEEELAWIATLHIPPQFPGNEGQLLPSYLKTLVELDYSQDVLDECAGRIKWDRGMVVRNRLTYVRGICRNANAGQFRLSSYGLRYRSEREQAPVQAVETAKAPAAPVDRDFVANQIDEAKRRLRGGPR